MRDVPQFNSFFMGGFECSTHLLPSGRRLDMLAATGHDRHFRRDFERMRAMNITTARTGIRWHLIEKSPGDYDWSSVLPMLHAARDAGIQLLWDVCHYGYPDDLDIFSPEFVTRFRRLSKAFARMLNNEMNDPPVISPVNEISFFSWAAGESAHLNPYAIGRGFELKVQLVRAALECADAFREVNPRTRLLHTDPAIHILPDAAHPEDADTAAGYDRAQYQGWDMLSGRMLPELGGGEQYLDVIGVNFYPNNQWYYEGETIERDDPNYKPFAQLLREVYERYQRPLIISETGTEDDARPDWLRYVCDQVRVAMVGGIPIHGICLYPIVNFPGWADERHCHNGLWDYADDTGEREVCEPFAAEVLRQYELFAAGLQTNGA